MKNKNAISFYSFWSINDKLELTALKRQMSELKEAGLSGVVFHPRNYPGDPEYLGPEYMEILSQLILYAKALEMVFWIYDENGWPSGTAGGEVLRRYPALQCQWLELVEDGDVAAVIPKNRIHTFRRHEGSVCPENHGAGELCHIVLKSKKAVSSLDPKAAEAFVEITHERYKTGLSPEAFQYVTGFFSDEVAFLDGYSVSVMSGSIPWR